MNTDLPDLAELTARANRFAAYRIAAGSLAAALLGDNATVKDAVDKYFEVLDEFRSRED